MISITAINLILMLFCIMAYVKQDRVKPEFFFQSDEYIYSYQDGDDALLRSIMARDNRDGDITERIVIEKIVENESGSTVVVYYAVSDTAGNVAKISRVFPVDPATQEENGSVENEKYDEEKNIAAETVVKETGTEDTDQESSNEENSEQRSGGEQEPETGSMEEAPEEDNGENAEQAAVQPEAAEPVQQAAPPEDKSGNPILTLKKQEVTIEAGTSPPWTEMIETLRDDKDDYATLYYNLVISRFNRSQPGDYPVTLYTEDSDGNRSDTVSVIIHVK